jgi:hypothetical protein
MTYWIQKTKSYYAKTKCVSLLFCYNSFYWVDCYPFIPRYVLADLQSTPVSVLKQVSDTEVRLEVPSHFVFENSTKKKKKKKRTKKAYAKALTTLETDSHFRHARFSAVD